MKLNVSKLVAGALIALALPLLSACYATVGTDGRTYFQPMGLGQNYGYRTAYGYGYTNAAYRYDLTPGYGYTTTAATPQGYTCYTPSALGMTYVTIPATRDYTSFPIVSRKIVGTSDACIVRPKPRMDCK